MNIFKIDNAFSKHKDLLLKNYWKSISFEGRFVLTGSEFLQKTHGIDIILQTNDDLSDIKIDTKHIRGKYNKLFIEEMSCTVAGLEKPGWLLKEDGHPDYIIHVLNPLCFKCYDNCEKCEKPIRSNMIGYITNFAKLRVWYIDNKGQFELFVNKTKNKTSGRNIPISVLETRVGTRLCKLSKLS